MVFGDSNTFLPDRSNTRWPTLLKDNDPVKLDTINEGFNGRTTKYDLGECNGLNVIRDKLKANYPLDYVIVMLGTNDVKNIYGPPGIADISDGMRKILDIIATEDDSIEPIVVTPPPLGNVTSGDLKGAQSLIPLVVKEFRLLAMNYDIRLTDVNGIIDIKRDLEHDRIHLNDLGRKKVSNAVWENLQNVTSPSKVAGLSGMRNGSNCTLTWNSTDTDVFYYRVRKNSNVIGRTVSTNFNVNTPVSGDNFTVEAIDFSQNTGPFSTHVTFKASGNFTVSRDSPSNSFR